MKADKTKPFPKAEVPEVKNYSQTKRAVLDLIGPTARVWMDEPGKEPVIMIGIDQKPGRLILGFGETFQDALANAVAAHRA